MYARICTYMCVSMSMCVLCVYIFCMCKWYVYIMCICTNTQICICAQCTYICVYVIFFLLVMSKQSGDFSRAITFHVCTINRWGSPKASLFCAKRKKKRKLAQSTMNTCSVFYISLYEKGGAPGISLEFALPILLNHRNPEGASIHDGGWWLNASLTWL